MCIFILAKVCIGGCFQRCDNSTQQNVTPTYIISKPKVRLNLDLSACMPHHSFCGNCQQGYTVNNGISMSKIKKYIDRSGVQIIFKLTVMSYDYRSFIPEEITFTKHHLTWWISKLPDNFELYWIRQYVVGPLGIVNVYKTQQISTGFGHG